MSKYLELVKDFHQTFNHPVETVIKEDNMEDRELRLKLLYEELEELSNAMGTDEVLHSLCKDTLLKPVNKGVYDKVETLDALCDIQYVLSGAVLTLGYTNVFDDTFEEVQRSNMSKMCLSKQQVDDTIKFYKEVKGEKLDIDYTKIDNGYIVLREDNKILKNVHYSPANIGQFIK